MIALRCFGQRMAVVSQSVSTTPRERLPTTRRAEMDKKVKKSEEYHIGILYKCEDCPQCALLWLGAAAKRRAKHNNALWLAGLA